MGETIVLLPCPFCGGPARYGTAGDDSNDGGEFIECAKCKACSVMMFPLKEDVRELLAERWNERAALTPPGHVIVGPDARETVARELWEFNRACEWTEATEEEKTDYLLVADAVLAALGVRGGA